MSFVKVVISCVFAFSMVSCSQNTQPKTYRLAKGHENVLPESPKQPPSGSITWETPETWFEQPAQGMRTGSFMIRDDTGKEVDVSIIYLGGMAGGDLANVNRWRDQISLKPWSEQEFAKHTTDVNTALGKGKLVAFANSESNTRIVAAIVPYGEGTWFFKMMGADLLATENNAQFLTFISSVRMVRE